MAATRAEPPNPAPMTAHVVPLPELLMEDPPSVGPASRVLQRASQFASAPSSPRGIGSSSTSPGERTRGGAAGIDRDLERCARLAPVEPTAAEAGSAMNA